MLTPSGRDAGSHRRGERCIVNTCIVCLGTVAETAAGDLELVGEPFLPSLAHAHQTTGTRARTALPLAA